MLNLNMLVVQVFIDLVSQIAARALILMRVLTCHDLEFDFFLWVVLADVFYAIKDPRHYNFLSFLQRAQVQIYLAV